MGDSKIVNWSKLTFSDLAYRLSNKGKVGLLFMLFVLFVSLFKVNFLLIITNADLNEQQLTTGYFSCYSSFAL